MEYGLYTVIGPSGARLSGGQAQRLALARTLAHPRPVLVLDDPFSALDRSTEDAIFAELQAYARDKVVFLISHRLYHFPQMQQIIFMEGGRTTVGTHEELMAAVPVYRQLYESQTGLKGGEGAGKRKMITACLLPSGWQRLRTAFSRWARCCVWQLRWRHPCCRPCCWPGSSTV